MNVEIVKPNKFTFIDLPNSLQSTWIRFCELNEIVPKFEYTDKLLLDSIKDQYGENSLFTWFHSADDFLGLCSDSDKELLAKLLLEDFDFNEFELVLSDMFYDVGFDNDVIIKANLLRIIFIEICNRKFDILKEKMLRYCKNYDKKYDKCWKLGKRWWKDCYEY